MNHFCVIYVTLYIEFVHLKIGQK